MNLPTLLRRVRRTALVLATAVLAASCGGGVSTTDPFEPVRVLSFGDEASVLDDSAEPGNARKWTINGVDDDEAVDCTRNPIWVQSVAASFGHIFPQCNPRDLADLPSRNYAAAGAKVEQLAEQITAHLAGGTGFGENDLVTVFVGINDVREVYGQRATMTEDQMVGEMEKRGTALGEQVLRITDAGGKVLVVTVPDLSGTPFGRAEETALAGSGALLRKLSARFNAKLRTTLPVDAGRSIGLVLFNDLIDAVLRDSSTAYANKTDAACDLPDETPLTACTTETLVTDEDNDPASTYVWADRIWPSASIQGRLGTQATNQARRNPF